jgi:SAM-dependent MidA family methyltransferase
MDITPSIEETSHSQTLTSLIQKEIESNKGQISFAKYMEMALYTPGFGYYAAGKTKFGSQGDFITAPEISPFFGATIVQSLKPILNYFQEQKIPLDILEFGAGTGALAESILNELARNSIQINSYKILDLSADLIQRQQDRLNPQFKNVEWLTALPKQFDGILLANEVLDAMPIELITFVKQQWHYQDVKTRSHSNLTDIPFEFSLGKPVPQEQLSPLLQESIFEDGYTTELHPIANAWIKQLATVLNQGVLLAIDYGFPEQEYYHPQRHQGTVMGHYAHHAVQNPFFYPGLCDLTAHVEWSSIAQTASSEGMNLLGYTSQASYLLDAGITQLLLDQINPTDSQQFIPVSNAIQKLLSEAEMGELFKVMCLGKNMPFQEGELPGFRSRPRAL